MICDGASKTEIGPLRTLLRVQTFFQATAKKMYGEEVSFIWFVDIRKSKKCISGLKSLNSSVLNFNRLRARADHHQCLCLHFNIWSNICCSMSTTSKNTCPNYSRHYSLSDRKKCKEPWNDTKTQPYPSNGVICSVTQGGTVLTPSLFTFQAINKDTAGLGWGIVLLQPTTSVQMFFGSSGPGEQARLVAAWGRKKQASVAKSLSWNKVRH